MKRIYLSFVIFLSMPVFVAGDTLENRFIGEFQRAHEEKDLGAMSKLVYWKGVEPQTRDSMERSFRVFFQKEIESLNLVDPTGKEVNEFKKDGKTYSTNLKVVKLLVIRYKSQDKKPQVTGMTFRLGMNAGRYFIATAAPIQ